MPNRIIKESICTSDTIDRLNSDEECFFYRILVNCDDFGRLDARIPILTSKCYPLKSNTIKHTFVEKMLNNLQNVGLLFLYCHGKYLQVKTWESHQQIRAKRSKYPEPDDSEIICNQLISGDSICHRNPIQSESESNLLFATSSYDYFSDFWFAYPKARRKVKPDAAKVWKQLKVNNDDLMEKVMLALTRDINSDDWKKGFIPYPAKWLKGKRWEDEL